MTPYYERNGVALFNADSLNAPLGIADVFIADPPYARSGGISTGRKALAGVAEESAGSEQFWLYWFSEIAKRLAQATKRCGFVFTDYRTVHLVEQAFAQTRTGWMVSQCLVWHRQGLGLGSPFRASHELIAFCRSPRFVWAGRKNIPNVLEFRWPYGEHDHHPAEKPVALLEFLIRESTAVGDVVLDPFAGSGSTLLAARREGRQCRGIEIEERYCAIAVERLAHERLQFEASA